MEWRLPEDTLKQLEKVQDSLLSVPQTLSRKSQRDSLELHVTHFASCRPMQDREPVDDPSLVGDAQAGMGEDAKMPAGGSQRKP